MNSLRTSGDTFQDSGYVDRSSRIQSRTRGDQKENASPPFSSTPTGSGRRVTARKSLASNWSNSDGNAATATVFQTQQQQQQYHPSNSLLSNPETPSKSLLGAEDGGDSSSLLISPPAILKGGVGTLTPPDEVKRSRGGGRCHETNEEGDKNTPPKSKVLGFVVNQCRAGGNSHVCFFIARRPLEHDRLRENPPDLGDDRRGPKLHQHREGEISRPMNSG